MRCRIDLGEFREAAADCESLLERSGEFELIKEILTPNVYEAAINAYEADGQIERALTLSERWLTDLPKCKGIHERRSRIFARQCRFDLAYEELRAEADQDPTIENDPRAAMALALGALYKDPETQWETFRKQLDPADLARVEAVTRIHWPQIERLTPRNQKAWLNCCYLMLHQKPDDPAMFVARITSLIEDELKQRVFLKFRAECSSELAKVTTASDLVAAYFSGKGDKLTLGQMLNAMNKERYPEASTETVRLFRDWLAEKYSDIRRINLSRLYNLHIPGKHTSERDCTWKDAAELASLSRSLLSVILTPAIPGMPQPRS